jgi:hypothetical protein
LSTGKGRTVVSLLTSVLGVLALTRSFSFLLLSSIFHFLRTKCLLLPISIPLTDGAEASSLTASEVYQLRKTPSIPGVSSDLLPDSHPYWVIWRRIVPSSGNAFYSPVYAFLLQSVPFRDFITANHFQSTHPAARFRNFFVATLPRANGERVTLQYTDGQVDPQGKKAAKFTRSSALTDEGKQGEELETRWVEMKVRAVRKVLEAEFGMLFPDEYAGN